MFALIDKNTNTILRVAPHGGNLSNEKPFKWVDCPDTCTTMWTYDGTTFSAPQQDPLFGTTSDPIIVTACQFRLAILKLNLNSEINRAMVMFPPNKRAEAQVRWEYETKVNRHSELIESIFANLGYSPDRVDEIFALAATL